MPIISERVAPGIYRNRWQGHVTADEVLEAFEREIQMAEEDEIRKRVSIIDGEEIRTFPMNVMKLSKIVSPDVLATLVYKVPNTARTIGELIGSLAKTPIEFFDNWEKTVERASEIIKEEVQK